MKQMRAMRQQFHLFSTILLGCWLLLAGGCSEENYYIVKPTTEPDTDTYTIMLYGTGGGNLDPELLLNLNEAIAEGVNDRVQFTAQVKFSKAWQEEHPSFAGTLRCSLADVADGEIVPAEVLSASLPFYDPQTLADFITWSKASAPADQYILVLWNHGDGWRPKYDRPKGRAICFDDHLEGMPGMSLDELIEGVKRSDTHFKMVYYDACLMALIENYAALAEVADYALGSSHSTPAIGGDYAALLWNLKQSTDFEAAISTYCDDVVRHWELLYDAYSISLHDLSYMDEVLSATALLSETLREIMEHDPDSAEYDPEMLEAIDYALFDCYRYNDNYPYFDLSHWAEALAINSTGEHYPPRFIRAASNLSRALAQSLVHGSQTSWVEAVNLSLGVTIVGRDQWQSLGYEGVYDALRFDRLTQWGAWMKCSPLLTESAPYIPDEEE